MTAAQKALSDFTNDEILAEIDRRARVDAKGFCWYCGDPIDEHTCKHHFGVKDVRPFRNIPTGHQFNYAPGGETGQQVFRFRKQDEATAVRIGAGGYVFGGDILVRYVSP